MSTTRYTSFKKIASCSFKVDGGEQYISKEGVLQKLLGLGFKVSREKRGSYTFKLSNPSRNLINDFFDLVEGMKEPIESEDQDSFVFIDKNNTDTNSATEYNSILGSGGEKKSSLDEKNYFLLKPIDPRLGGREGEESASSFKNEYHGGEQQTYLKATVEGTPDLSEYGLPNHDFGQAKELSCYETENDCHSYGNVHKKIKESRPQNTTKKEGNRDVLHCDAEDNDVHKVVVTQTVTSKDVETLHYEEGQKANIELDTEENFDYKSDRREGKEIEGNVHEMERGDMLHSGDGSQSVKRSSQKKSQSDESKNKLYNNTTVTVPKSTEDEAEYYDASEQANIELDTEENFDYKSDRREGKEIEGNVHEIERGDMLHSGDGSQSVKRSSQKKSQSDESKNKLYNNNSTTVTMPKSTEDEAEYYDANEQANIELDTEENFDYKSGRREGKEIEGNVHEIERGDMLHSGDGSQSVKRLSQKKSQSDESKNKLYNNHSITVTVPKSTEDEAEYYDASEQARNSNATKEEIHFLQEKEPKVTKRDKLSKYTREKNSSNPFDESEGGKKSLDNQGRRVSEVERDRNRGKCDEDIKVKPHKREKGRKMDNYNAQSDQLLEQRQSEIRQEKLDGFSNAPKREPHSSDINTRFCHERSESNEFTNIEEEENTRLGNVMNTRLRQYRELKKKKKEEEEEKEWGRKEQESTTFHFSKLEYEFVKRFFKDFKELPENVKEKRVNENLIWVETTDAESAKKMIENKLEECRISIDKFKILHEIEKYWDIYFEKKHDHCVLITFEDTLNKIRKQFPNIFDNIAVADSSANIVHSSASSGLGMNYLNPEADTLLMKTSYLEASHAEETSVGQRAEERSHAQQKKPTKASDKFRGHCSDLVVKIFKADITKLDVDVIVNAANRNLRHGGGVAKAIADAAGMKLQNDCKDHIKKNGSIEVTHHFASTGGNLKAKTVFHAVGPKWKDYNRNDDDSVLDCTHDLRMTILLCLYYAERKGYHSIAFPSISAAIFGVPKDICVESYMKGVQHFEKLRSTDNLKEVLFVDIDDNMVNAIREQFDGFWDCPLETRDLDLDRVKLRKFFQGQRDKATKSDVGCKFPSGGTTESQARNRPSSSHIETNASNLKRTSAPSYANVVQSESVDLRSKGEGARAKVQQPKSRSPPGVYPTESESSSSYRTGRESFPSSYETGIKSPQSVNHTEGRSRPSTNQTRSESHSNAHQTGDGSYPRLPEEELQISNPNSRKNSPSLKACEICAVTKSEFASYTCCHKSVCTDCKVRLNKCPFCRKIQREITGDMPDGFMEIKRRATNLCGFPNPSGHFEINYFFNELSHSRPHWTAYLPDTKEGLHVLKLLLVAFRRRLTFTKGTSITTGKPNQITWNGIHHKTSLQKGHQFGYPDDTYLMRVCGELKEFGVSLKAMTSREMSEVDGCLNSLNSYYYARLSTPF